MSKDLILVIDMQNVYASDGQWACANAETAAQRIGYLLDSVEAGMTSAGKQKGEKSADIIFTKFLAPEEPVGVWKQYNIENSQVNEDAYANAMMDLFEDYIESYPVYIKSTYSSLTIPEVLEAALKADRVVVTGVVAECCVLATVMALIDAGSSVVYLTDAVAGIDQETENAVELILSGLEPLHVQRKTVEQYLLEKGE